MTPANGNNLPPSTSTCGAGRTPGSGTTAAIRSAEQQRTSGTPDSTGRKRPRTDPPAWHAKPPTGAPSSKGDASKNIEEAAPAQRRRRRRIIQETPSSDDEEEEDSVVEVPLENVTPVSARPQIVNARDDEDGNTRRKKVAKPLSFGTQSSGENFAETQTNRRSLRLRRQNTLAPARSGSSGQAVSIDSEPSDRRIEPVPARRRYSNVHDFFGVGVSALKAHDRVLKLIGGAVSKDQVQHLFPGAAGDSPPEWNNTRQEPNASDQGGNPVHEDSPLDFTNDNVPGRGDSIFLTRDITNDGSAALRLRDRATDDHLLSFSMLDLPKTVTQLSEVLPRHLYSIPYFSPTISVVEGNKEDDASFRNAVECRDWLYSAESMDFDSLSRESLLQKRLSMSDISSCLKHIRSSNLLSKLPNIIDLRPEKARVLLGICLRLLSLDLEEHSMSVVLSILMRTRDAEQKNGGDSLLPLISRTRGNSTSYHQYMQSVWVCFLDACRRAEGGPSSFWALFNKNWFGHAPETGKPRAVSLVVPDEKHDKVLNSLITLGSLFAFQLEKPDEKEQPVVLTPNWTSIELVLKNISEQPCSKVEEPRQSMFQLLQTICSQFADRLWKVEEAFVLNVLDCIKSVCVKFDSACSCSSIPAFLGQFKNIGDLRSRRHSLLKYLRTECDCAMFLAWLLIAQEPKTSSKLSTKIIRHSTVFLKTAGCSKDPARALTHHIGLMLTISESIVQGNPNKEHLLRSMLFSKAPKLAQAASDPFSFGPSSIACWASVLEAVKLRVRILLGAGSSIDGYSDFICSNVASCLQFIEKPESQFAGNPKKREAWRVQQRIFVDLVVKLLSTFMDVLALLSQYLSQETYTNHAAIDDLLISLSKFVGRLGKFATGIVAQIGINNSGGNVSSGQKAMLKVIVSFIEQGLDLCTVHSHGRTRRENQSSLAYQMPTPPSNPNGSLSGIDAYVKNVKGSMLTAFVTLARQPSVKDEPKSEWELRLVACKALAKTLGLCCIGPSPDFTRLSSMNLLQVIQQANMSIFDMNGTLRPYAQLRAPVPIQPPRVPVYSRTSQYSRPPNCSQARTYSQGPNYSQAANQSQHVNPQAQWHAQEADLLMQAEFWGVLLDSMWSRALLSVSERLEEIVFGMWVIIIVASSSSGHDAPLRKSLSGLSYGIQSAASNSANIGKWFYATKFGKSCGGTTVGPGGTRLSVTDLGGQERVEALVDSFCAILLSWTSSKVLNLLNFIRGYVTTNSTSVRSFAAPAPRAFFRPSKDVEQAEQLLLHTQVLSVLFVIHASLSLPSSQYRGGRVGNDGSVSTKFLNDISDSLTRALNKFRSGPSSKYAAAHVQIQVLVVKALAMLGYNTKDVETRIGFTRFVRLFSGENLSGLFTWNDESSFVSYLQREPFMLAASGTDPHSLNRRQTLERNGQEWRGFAFHALVVDAIESKTVNSVEVRGAVRHILEVLECPSLANIRNTGMWPSVCKAVMLIGQRRHLVDMSSVHGVAVNSLLSKIWNAVRRLTPESEHGFFKAHLVSN